MVTALIMALFVIQLITIFVIILLYGKLSKFKELEIRQNRLVEEMDNAIGVYLMEMKEENDRLIQELTNAKASVASVKAGPAKAIIQTTEPIFTHVEESSTMVNVKKIFDEIADQQVATEPVLVPKEVPEFDGRKFVPVQKAASAYSKQKSQTNEQQELEQIEIELFAKHSKVKEALTFEQQVVAHYKAGKSIEEIAKMMQRGKTEIELLVKFHA